MSIKTGEFLGQLVLALTPSAVGEALNGLSAASTPADWVAAVEANAVGEDQDVANELAGFLQTGSLLQALLQPADNTTQPIGLILKNRIWTIGATAGVLNSPWETPPHPSGEDAITLYSTVAAFDET